MSTELLAISLAYLSGLLTSEVVCMLFERRPYMAAVATFVAILLLVTAKKSYG